MATKITFIGAAPAPTSGADVVNNGPQTPAVADQNLANLQAAVDGKSPIAGPGSSQAFATGALTVSGALAVSGAAQVVAPAAVSGNAFLAGVAGVSNGYALANDGSNNLTHSWCGTGGAERMRIDSSGNLLVGVASGSHHIMSKSANNAAALEIYNTYAGPAQALTTNILDTTGYGFINYTSGVGKSYVTGAGTFGSATNVYGAYSDLKLKQDITDVDSQWNDIKDLRLRKYRFKNDPAGCLQLGLIAQEVEVVSPGLVDETPDYETIKTVDAEGNETEEKRATGETTKSVKYSIVYLKAVGALQENMKRTEDLETENAEFRATFASLIERIAALESEERRPQSQSRNL